MKKIMTLLAAAALLVAAGCSREGLGRRNGGSAYNEMTLTENPDITISYVGRGHIIDPHGNTLVTDNFHIQSAGVKPYFLDAVSANELKGVYGGSLGRFATASESRIQKEVREGEASWADVLFSGNQDFPAYRFGDPGEKWYVVAFGTDEQGRFDGTYSRLAFTTEEVTMNKGNLWSVSVGPRSFITEGGRRIEVENFLITTTSPSTYNVGIISVEDFQQQYKNKPFDYFSAQLDALGAGLGENDPDFSPVLWRGDDSARPDRLWSGNYILFCYGVDLYGYLTGEYSEFRFFIEEEAATAEFSRWIGDWTLSGLANTYDRNGRPAGKLSVEYPIHIESAENNVYFAIQGWETGESVDTEVDQYTRNFWLGAQYDAATGRMQFVPYEVDNYEGNDKNTYVTSLLGVYQYEDALETAIGDAVIAEAILSDDDHATVQGCKTTLLLDDEGKQTAEVEFVMMQYWDIRIDPQTGNYLSDENGIIMGYLNASVPFFTYNDYDSRGKLLSSTPMTLTRVGAGGSGGGQVQQPRVRTIRHTAPAATKAAPASPSVRAFRTIARRPGTAPQVGHRPVTKVASGRTPAPVRPKRGA